MKEIRDARDVQMGNKFYKREKMGRGVRAKVRLADAGSFCGFLTGSTTQHYISRGSVQSIGDCAV